MENSINQICHDQRTNEKSLHQNLHTDNMETVAVQMEWMAQIGLLYFIDQNDFDNGIQWNIDFMCAHAIGSAVGWAVVTVTELLRIYVIVL